MPLLQFQDPEVTRVLLIRHARTALNTADKIAGDKNTPIDEIGEQQAITLARRLAREFQVTALYVSPYKRALQTASAIKNELKLEIIQDDDLVELGFGKLGDLSFEEIAAYDPDLHARLKKFVLAPPDTTLQRPAIPGGEPLNAVRDRVLRFTKRITEKHKGQTVAVVTHGGLIRIAMTVFGGGDLSKRIVYWADNASITIVDFFNGNPTFRLFNDKSHLKESYSYGKPKFI